MHLYIKPLKSVDLKLKILFTKQVKSNGKAKPQGQRLSHRCQSSSAPSPACGSYWVSSEWGLGGRWLCPEGQIEGREVRQTERGMFQRRRDVHSPHHFVLSLLCQAMRPFVKLPGFDTLIALHCESNANKELKYMVASVTYCVSS